MSMSLLFGLYLLCLQRCIYSVVIHSADASHTICMMFIILLSLVVAGGIWLSVFTFSVACSLYRLAIHGVGWLLAS